MAPRQLFFAPLCVIWRQNARMAGLAAALLVALQGCRIASPLVCDDDQDCPRGATCSVEHFCLAAARGSPDARPADAQGDDGAGADHGAIADAAAGTDAACADRACGDQGAEDAADAARTDGTAADHPHGDGAQDARRDAHANDANAADSAAPDDATRDAGAPADSGLACWANGSCPLPGVTTTEPWSQRPLQVWAPRLRPADGGMVIAVAALLAEDGGAGEDASSSDSGRAGRLVVEEYVVSAAQVSMQRLDTFGARRVVDGPTSGLVDWNPAEVPWPAVAVTTRLAASDLGKVAFFSSSLQASEVALGGFVPTTRALLFDGNGGRFDEMLVGSRDGRVRCDIDLASSTTLSVGSAPVAALALGCQAEAGWLPIVVASARTVTVLRLGTGIPVRLQRCASATTDHAVDALVSADFGAGRGPVDVIALTYAPQAALQILRFDATQPCGVGALALRGAPLLAPTTARDEPAVARTPAGARLVVVLTSGALWLAQGIHGSATAQHVDTALGPGGSGAITGDVNGDGDDEIFALATNGWVHAWRSDGTPLGEGWPTALGAGAPFSQSPVLGDLDGDGATLELAAVDDSGALHLVRWGAGSLRGGSVWPQRQATPGGSACAP